MGLSSPGLHLRRWLLACLAAYMCRMLPLCLGAPEPYLKSGAWLAADEGGLDGETLLAWKRSWRQVPRAIASGEQAWRNGTNPCNGTADWLGVTCDGARVVELKLESLDLVGSLIPRLAELDALVSLELVDLPRLTGTIPEAFKQFRRLTNLRLERTGLTGGVTIKRMRRLETLQLSGNGFSGPLRNVRLPSSLKEVTITNENFTGSWPLTWSSLELLESLELRVPGLWGPLPDALAMPPNLAKLVIISSGIEGGWPESWQSLGKLQSLFLLGNDELAGVLPPATQLPFSTQLLYLQGNNFSGSLPPSWGAPEALPNLSYRVLLFNNSELQGTIPSSWAAPSSPFVQRNISLFLKPGTGLCGRVPPTLLGNVRQALQEPPYEQEVDHLGSCPCLPPPGNYCSSEFFALPKVTFKGRDYFLAYVEKTARSTATQFCQSQQAGPYAASGALRQHTLPPRFSAQAPQWRTFDPDTGELCVGEECPAFAVVECVKEGAEPLAKDDEGNIGCGNTGSNNVGSWNSGSSNWGGCNSGDDNVGDSSSGSNIIGDTCSESNMFGSCDQPWSWPL